MKEIPAGARVRVALRLNGRPVAGRAEARTQLADFLRHELGALGTHVGCEHGICGACTVLVDGRPTRSCLMLAVQAEGCAVTTIEGLAGADGSLGPLQRAFARNFALQCGFCTPGILLAATQFLRAVPLPSEEAIRDMLSGHLCRCTGYRSIVAAILEAAREMAADA
jgi:2-furoyl-CoA dehydrogenase 2Fe-2S iron sulfur subunit